MSRASEKSAVGQPDEAQLDRIALIDVAEEAVALLEHVLDGEDIDYLDCAAVGDHPLCGAAPCQAIGCLVDKLRRANNVLTEVAIAKAGA